MAKKRKRDAPAQYEEERIEHASNYNLKQPTEEGVHLYMQKDELPWDIEP